ncbi:unnamed protein product [Linum tenue]|uniref:Uncharacterized protein n=1 Tax=Linum tenue TaxID=586396 RepID=A0AAV0HLR4_9ROSI|nr:unnamed protein product [Linum tenue]
MVDDSAVRAKTPVSDVSTSRKKKKFKLDTVMANCLIWSADFPDKGSNQGHGTITDVKKAKGVPEELPIALGLGAIDNKCWMNLARMNSVEHSQQKVAGSQGRKSVTGNQQDVAGSQGRKSTTGNQQNVAGSQRRKRGRPRKVVVTYPMTETGMEISDTVNGSQMVVKVVTDHEVGGQLQPENEYSDAINERAMKIADDVPGIESLGNEATDLVLTTSGGVVEDHQPLSIWLGGLSCSSTSNGLCDGKHRQQVVTLTTSPPVSTSSDDALPFVKRSPLWAILESEEIFQNMPHKPHFLPLMECKEDYREGVAIGITATFLNLLEKISSLGIDDSRTLFETTLDSLSEMEMHGFDVTLPRGRINKLLSIREPLSECPDIVKNAERELQQHSEEKRKLDAAIQHIQKEISALQQTLATTRMELDANEARTAVVQSWVDEMKGRFENARNEFKRVAAGPWN